MSGMMEAICRNMDPEGMRSMMESMPAVIEQCCAAMDAEDLGAMMEEWMPTMMGSCLSMMDAEHREGVVSMCRDMFDQFEEKGSAHEA